MTEQNYFIPEKPETGKNLHYRNSILEKKVPGPLKSWNVRKMSLIPKNNEINRLFFFICAVKQKLRLREA